MGGALKYPKQRNCCYPHITHDQWHRYQPRIAVPKGVVEVRVGGGQPDYYAGSLMQRLLVTTDRELSRSFECVLHV